jgi:hypothetical protein
MGSPCIMSNRQYTQSIIYSRGQIIPLNVSTITKRYSLVGVDKMNTTRSSMIFGRNAEFDLLFALGKNLINNEHVGAHVDGGIVF